MFYCEMGRSCCEVQRKSPFRHQEIMVQLIGSHGGLESIEIQKKMPGFLHPYFFLLGIPKVSQKCPFLNILYPCPRKKNQFFKFMN